MDKSLRTLCDALKKIIAQLKPQTNPLSLIIMTGKIKQGKTALLRQSNLQHFLLDEDSLAHLYYNNHGVIIDLGESWLNQSENLLAYSLKQINRCHLSVKISGLILCVDSRELLQVEAMHLQETCQNHTQLLTRFGQALGYRVDVAVMFTKLDNLAGFTEFFQSEHVHDLQRPLGFSLNHSNQRNQFITHYKTQFDQMIEVLGQQIIHKLHPARSTIKRTLIREFPLQLTCLRIPVQTLLQQIPVDLFRIKAVYFSSAEQGGVSVDRLNKKIQHEYALSVQDQFPQSSNYRPYFIEGALSTFQEQSKRALASLSNKHKMIAALSILAIVGLLATMSYRHAVTSRLLDEASKELLAYEALSNDKTVALFHLSQAELKLSLIPATLFPQPSVEQLKQLLHSSTKNKIQESFLPDLISTLETILSNPAQSQHSRYQALKIYLMLAEPENFSENEIIQWFSKYWKQQNPSLLNNDKQIALLRSVLKQPFQPITINQQYVLDTRNYLNALPVTYLYYSLAKEQFPSETITLNITGFDLSNKVLPVYFSKMGYKQISTLLPLISAKLQQENWVLARQDLDNLPAKLEEAYYFDYANWWQNFIRRTQPLHYQGYQQARQLTQSLHKTQSIGKLVHLIQQQTGPDEADNGSLFNQKIANQFTALNLMTESATQDLMQNINELDKFLTTLSLTNDQGKTVFDLTKARFKGDTLSDPLSALYSKARQLPDPVAVWAKQIADDTWFIFINESRHYLNKQWQHRVYDVYQKTLASRYPFDPQQNEEVSINDFDHFFAPQGELNQFITQYLKPFIDTSHPQWQPREMNGYVLPVSAEMINELIRANVISNMFFSEEADHSHIEFSLQKINLDPIVANLQLTLGEVTLTDSQSTDSYTTFSWPQNNAKLTLNSIEGQHFELAETGVWAFFKMLQKVNVLVDSNDSASLQILFEVNGNSGRYVLKTQNQINPFSPGVLTGFNLTRKIA